MPLLRAEVRAVAPALPPPSVVSLEDRVAAVLVDERMLAALSSAIGVLAAILAAVGIYSTVASAVARRQREIGVRMALGALPGQVARMVVGEAFAIVAGGLARRDSRGIRRRAGRTESPGRRPLRAVAHGPAHLVELDGRDSRDRVARRVPAGAPRGANRSRRLAQIRVKVRRTPKYLAPFRVEHRP